MTNTYHQTNVWVWFMAAILAGCGGPPPDPNLMSCKVTEGSHAECMEYVRPRSDLSRSSIFAQCRDGGGVIVDACPTENLIGTCERATDPRQPTSLSERVRMKTYFEPGGVNPPDAGRLRKQCDAGAGIWTPPAAEGSP